MLLEVQHVRKEFQNRTHALTGASFSVSQGDFVSVIGPSGAGKTTLFRILNGSLRCDGGAILVNGVHFESADRRTRRAIQTTIGTIYQDFCLVENSTCLANVLTACLPDMGFFPAVFGIYGKKRRAEALKFLDRVGLLEKSEEPVKNLSGGQKQRISIARALAKNTPILVMDDSTSALDMETEHEIQKTLHDLNHTTKLIIAHRISAVRHADEIIVLENGSIHERGTHEELMQKRGLYYATYLSQYGAYTAPGVDDSHKKEA